MKKHVLAAVAALAIGGSARAGVLDLKCSDIEPKLTVRQAIDLLVRKAVRGERLPDIPNEGA